MIQDKKHPWHYWHENHQNYKGWQIDGEGNSWCALSWGIRMQANSLKLLKTMIDLREADPKNRMIPYNN